jgi:hypothetical protein
MATATTVQIPTATQVAKQLKQIKRQYIYREEADVFLEVRPVIGWAVYFRRCPRLDGDGSHWGEAKLDARSNCLDVARRLVVQCQDSLAFAESLIGGE